jgi:hypothetical protein
MGFLGVDLATLPRRNIVHAFNLSSESTAWLSLTSTEELFKLIAYYHYSIRRRLLTRLGVPVRCFNFVQ